MSSDLLATVSREDDLYMRPHAEGSIAPPPPKPRLGSAAKALEAFANGGTAESKAPPAPPPAPQDEDSNAASAVAPSKPCTAKEYEDHAIASIAAFAEAAPLQQWFFSKAEARLRTQCSVSGELFEELKELIATRIDQIAQQQSSSPMMDGEQGG
jgi:hypothetical protein